MTGSFPVGSKVPNSAATAALRRAAARALALIEAVNRLDPDDYLELCPEDVVLSPRSARSRGPPSAPMGCGGRR